MRSVGALRATMSRGSVRRSRRTSTSGGALAKDCYRFWHSPPLSAVQKSWPGFPVEVSRIKIGADIARRTWRASCRFLLARSAFVLRGGGDRHGGASGRLFCVDGWHIKANHLRASARAIDMVQPDEKFDRQAPLSKRRTPTVFYLPKCRSCHE